MEFPFRNATKGFCFLICVCVCVSCNPQDDTSGSGVISQVTAEWEEIEQSRHSSSAENISIERRIQISAGHSLILNVNV